MLESKRQRWSGEKQYQKITSLSLTAKREMRTAFHTFQASSSKLFTWSESDREGDRHGSQMAITKMVSAPNCTWNSNGKKAILCRWDPCPHLLFSHLMASWYTSKTSLEENTKSHLNIFTGGRGYIRLTSGRVLVVMIHVVVISVKIYICERYGWVKANPNCTVKYRLMH